MKKNILVNFQTYNSGGANITKKEFVKNLKNSCTEHNYFIIINENIESESNIKYIKLPIIFEKKFLLIFSYLIIIPYIIKKYNIYKVLNFGDIPIFTNSYQIFYFDWPYAVYPDSIVWKKMSLSDSIYRKIKIFLFKSLYHKCNLFIVQSNVIHNRLKKYFDVSNVSVIGMGYENKFHNLTQNKINKHDINLLYPTKYYPHKNIEILISLGIILKKNDSNIRIYCTVDTNQHPNVSKVIESIVLHQLEDYIVITGELDREKFSNIFESVDGIIMPTLLETYGIPYLEAIAAKKLIFTSDLDFAHVTCGNSAIYFDPLDADDIYEKLIETFNDQNKIDTLYNEGIEVLKKQRSWKSVVDDIINHI